MDGRKAMETVVDLTTVRHVTDGSGDEHRGAPATMRLTPRMALFAGLLTPVIVGLCIAVEPAPANPNAADPWWGTVLFLTLLTAVGFAAVHAAQRRASALGWAAGGAALAVVLTIACPVSAHHASIGAWWYAQLAVASSGLLAAFTARRWLTAAR